MLSRHVFSPPQRRRRPPQRRLMCLVKTWRPCASSQSSMPRGEGCCWFRCEHSPMCTRNRDCLLLRPHAHPQFGEGQGCALNELFVRKPARQDRDVLLLRQVRDRRGDSRPGRAQRHFRRALVSVPALRRQGSGGPAGLLELPVRSNEGEEGENLGGQRRRMEGNPFLY